MTLTRTPLLIAALLFASIATQATHASEFAPLPIRTTPVPATTSGVPHVQLGGESNPALIRELMTRASRIPDVDIRDTVISMPGATAFWIEEHVTLSNPQAIVGGREFAHMHPDGSLHASLSPSLAVKAVNGGWAIAHPWANKRKGWEGFVMIYTPTTDREVETVYQLVLASFDFVTGQQLSTFK
ncbi:luciferase domain-containing protein [Enterovibrio calviensis]|uniref:luciferase domain-containing protein n=1 Tax=Enterovibrio calviensis TaxID=91359 RepID=UPI000482D58F|nr:luciferase family protein [Enterovibrio calviensis]